MPFLNARKKTLGFTLIELLVIILIGGILSAIAIPSFIGLVDKANLNNAVTEVRSALQTGQREAIRRSQVCTIGLSIAERKVTGYCLSGDRNLPERVALATNISKKPSSLDKTVEINFGILGTAEFILEDLDEPDDIKSSKVETKYLEMSWQSPQPTKDPSGKIVFSIANNSSLTKKCIAISNTLGLTRIGNYTGKIKKNYKLTKEGICTAS
ncbi:pilus assembly FimT family protein [Chlorogloea sp. CCALA 695]|uniref:pilus assembly FimT family protein n=1 Tax=Chlorogloea sp. CCALA 695 TaxID=2107693 RepID=UPI000D07E9A1|nr:prepilin-type N-terminal cleavage/methylation domain-containing protein [Chlorogloea sp. CCALA 695]PSB35041.1 hypothetical protein C7B70_01935 [Chlorogloea sp. CCALA 695]